MCPPDPPDLWRYVLSWKGTLSVNDSLLSPDRLSCPSGGTGGLGLGDRKGQAEWGGGHSCRWLGSRIEQPSAGDSCKVQRLPLASARSAPTPSSRNCFIY